MAATIVTPTPLFPRLGMWALCASWFSGGMRGLRKRRYAKPCGARAWTLRFTG